MAISPGASLRGRLKRAFYARPRTKESEMRGACAIVTRTIKPLLCGMSRWRPAPEIRFKALGVPWRGDRLLATEIRDDAGELKGLRPLGGTVAFGETAAAAVLREFQEELGITVTLDGPPVFMENIYLHEGQTGHELLAIFPVSIPPEALGDKQQITFVEQDGTECVARWVALDALDQPGEPRLFPDGLKHHLLAHR